MASVCRLRWRSGRNFSCTFQAFGHLKNHLLHVTTAVTEEKPKKASLVLMFS